MKVAAIQINAQTDKKKNLAKAIEMTREAASRGARLVVLPEAVLFRGALNKETLAAESERIPGASCFPFMEMTADKRIVVLLGSVLEQSSRRGKAYNTSVLINSRGRVQAVYRKKHLFDAVIGEKSVSESKFFIAGKHNSMTNVEGFRLGLSICFDLRFPEQFQPYAKKQCHVLAIPSCFAWKTGQAHWEPLLRARAIENFCFVIAPNQTGCDQNGIRAFGHSMIIGPWGEILAKASGHKEEIIYAEINKSAIKKAENILPYRRKR